MTLTTPLVISSRCFGVLHLPQALPQHNLLLNTTLLYLFQTNCYCCFHKHKDDNFLCSRRRRVALTAEQQTQGFLNNPLVYSLLYWRSKKWVLFIFLKKLQMITLQCSKSHPVCFLNEMSHWLIGKGQQQGRALPLESLQS